MRYTFRRKRNRLPLQNYRGPALVSLTLACFNRSRAFVDPALVRACLENLGSSARRHGAKVHVYCFMPDHLHLLIEAGEATFIPDFVKDFKQRTGYAYVRAYGRPLWHKSYYDHILRSEEAVRDVARYIMGNPVRAGLVKEAGLYPHSGSFVWDRSAVLEA